MDTIKVTILEDGTIRTDNDRISGPNHSSAEQFMRDIAKLAGGKLEIEKKRPSAHHHHRQDAHQH